MKLLLLIAALAGVAVISGAAGMTVRKNLVSERQAIGADWSEVDRALAARADIVPELAHFIQADAPPHAGRDLAETLQAAAVARAAVDAAHSLREKIHANAQLDDALARLMLAIENYPKLERSKKYDDLLEALKSSEYRVAVVRRKYNEAVEHYNVGIDLFPNNIVASVTGMRKIDAYFQTSAF